MNPENIVVDNITISDKYVSYDDRQLIIKTGWNNTYYNKEYKTLTVNMKKDEALYKILAKIDELVANQIPNKCKQSRLLKQYTKENVVKEYITPKYTYSKIIDDNKKEKTSKVFDSLSNIECRFIFAIAPINAYKNFYGPSIKCQLIQYRNKNNENEYDLEF